MALNPDRPAGRRQQANPRGGNDALREAPVRTEIDRMVDEVQRGAREKNPEVAAARESEAMTRVAHDTIPGRDHIAPLWSRPIVRGLLKRVAGTADSINLEFANFPFIGEHVYRFFEHGLVRPIEETKQEAARSFYSMLTHHELFKAFKQAFREKRTLTSEDRKRIQDKIIAEQPHDPQEVVRQERTLEDFSRAIRQGRYGTAARTYERVAEYRNGWAMWEDCKKELKCKNAIEANKNKKKEHQKTEEDIRKEFFPDGLTENQRRNETLQKYLRITASRHVADMIEGRIDKPQAQFLVMFQKFWPLEKLSRDDIPLDDAKIAVFFSEIRKKVLDAIISAVRERQARQDAGQEGGVIGDAHSAHLRRMALVAFNLGILAPDDIPPELKELNLGRHLVEEGGAVSSSERDRIEREFTEKKFEGIIFPETAHASEELRAQAREHLAAAWRRDIANDNDSYSNFDNERCRTLERFDALPKATVKNERGEEMSAPAVIAFLQEQRTEKIKELKEARKKIEQSGQSPEDVQEWIHVAEREYTTYRERILGQTSILSPAEITYEIMNEEFRMAVMQRLLDAFRTDYEKYARQRSAIARVRSETYAPYRILEDAEIDEVRERIRQGPAREKLVDAFLRGGEPALQMEEEALQKIEIFTQEEIEDRRNAINQLIGARHVGLNEDIIANSEAQFIRMGTLTQNELELLRPEMERAAPQP